MKYLALSFASLLLWSSAKGSPIDDGLRRDPNTILLSRSDGTEAVPEPDLCCSPPPTVYRKCCSGSCGVCSSYSCDVSERRRIR